MKHASNLPTPRNEPVQDYVPGSVQRAKLKAAIATVENTLEAHGPPLSFHGGGVASAQHIFARAGLITMISVPKSNAGLAMARSSLV
jgi:hypothetical protein